MGTTAWWQAAWVWMGTGWVLCALGIVVLGWALFWDRARGRRRCSKCWYEMTGVPGLRCPECGKEARRERRLFKTRRRWGWATVAVLLLAGASLVFAWPRARRDGWLSMVPVRVLGLMLAMEPAEPRRTGPVWMELVTRAQASGQRGSRRPTSMEERAIMLERCVAGVPWARPGSERWRATYGEFLRAGAFSLYSVDPRGEVLPGRGCTEPISQRMLDAIESQEKLPFFIERIQTRDKWPEGHPVIVKVIFKHWWPMGTSEELVLKWRTGDGASGEIVVVRNRASIAVGRSGHVELDVEVMVQKRVINAPTVEVRNRRVLVGTQQAHLAYDTVATLEEAMPGVASAQLDALLKEMPRVEFDGQFRLGPKQMAFLRGKGFDDVVIAGTAGIYHDGKRVFDAGGGSWWIGGEGTRGGAPIDKGGARYVWDNWSKPGWTVRLTSDGEKASEVYEAKRYWKGEVEMPLTMVEPRALRPYVPRDASKDGK